MDNYIDDNICNDNFQILDVFPSPAISWYCGGFFFIGFITGYARK